VVPLDCYSGIPSVAEIEGSFEYREGEPPYLDPLVFQPHVLQATLAQLLPFAAEFTPPLAGDETIGTFYWQNGMFSFSDAMAYYCFLRWKKPSAVVEIGSGFSTLVALEALARNGSGTVHCFEPFPRAFLRRDSRIRLHEMPAQEIRLEQLEEILGDGDVLFVDSTHTVKAGSDCLHIYLRLLPRLRRHLYVHAHDVFLPYALPKDWLLDRQYYWTEQYLLLALLTDNPKATVLFGSVWNNERQTDLMQFMMGGKYPYGGSSLWFEYRNGIG
jgi:Methyltransferase domain